jgi:hypothetical protein
LAGSLVRETSFCAVEALVRSPVRRSLCVSQSFSEDTLVYFTARLDAGPTRRALAGVLRRAKRN